MRKADLTESLAAVLYSETKSPSEVFAICQVIFWRLLMGSDEYGSKRGSLLDVLNYPFAFSALNDIEEQSDTLKTSILYARQNPSLWFHKVAEAAINSVGFCDDSPHKGILRPFTTFFWHYKTLQRMTGRPNPSWANNESIEVYSRDEYPNLRFAHYFYDLDRQQHEGERAIRFLRAERARAPRPFVIHDLESFLIEFYPSAVKVEIFI